MKHYLRTSAIFAGLAAGFSPLPAPTIWAGEPATPAPAASSVEPGMKSLLQQGLYEEEASREFDKAADQYEKLLLLYDSQRQLAATALFRLAEVRRKQNRKEDAVKLYQRLLTEFPAADPLARLSQENLAALGAAPGKAPEAMAAVGSEEQKEILEMEELAKNSPDVLWSGDRLADAARGEKVKLLTYLLEKGGDLKTSEALERAAMNGNLAICELLLAKGAPVDGLNLENTPLGWATQRGYQSVVALLLEKGANPNLSEKGTRPLNSAVMANRVNIVKLLLKHGAEPNHVPEGDFTPEYSPEFPLGVKSRGEPPLNLALHGKNLELANLLLDHKADPKLAAKDTGVTPLHLACALGDLALVERLLAAGAEVNVKTKEQKNLLKDQTPLFLSLKHKSLEITKRLIAAGAKFADDPYSIPLAASHSKEALDLVLAQGAKDWKNAEGKDLLGLAVSTGNVEASESLLSQNPARESLNAALFGAFHLMSDAKTVAAGEKLRDRLIELGADPLAQKDGYYPFMSDSRAAEQAKHTERYLYPKLAQAGGVYMSLPLGGKYWTLSEPKTATIAPLADQLRKFYCEPIMFKFFGQNKDWNGGFKGAADFQKLTLLRKNPTTGQFGRTAIDLATLEAPPTLLSGDILEATITVPKDYPHFSGYYQNGPGPQPKQALPNEVLAHLRKLDRREITVKMEGAPEKLTLSGKLAVYVPTKPELPLCNAQRLFEFLGGKHPKFTGATIRVKRAEWGDLVAVEGTPTAAIELLAGDAVEISPTPEMQPKEGDPKLANEEMEKNWQRQMTLVSPGLPFAFSIGSDRSPSLLQLISQHYSPFLERQALAEQAPDTKSLLMAYTEHGGGYQVLPHPDFSKIRILRRSDGGTKEIAVDLSAAIQSCTADTPAETARTKDVELEQGDVVELPVIKDKLAEPWKGFDDKTACFFKKALSYRITVASGGKVLMIPFEYEPPIVEQTDAGMALIGNSISGENSPTVENIARQVIGGASYNVDVLRKEAKEKWANANRFLFLRDQDSLTLSNTGQVIPTSVPGTSLGPRIRVAQPTHGAPSSTTPIPATPLPPGN